MSDQNKANNFTCRSCNANLISQGNTTSLQTFYCSSCDQFQLQHYETKTQTEAWKEANISEVFLSSLEKRRRIQASQIIKKWGHQIKEPVLDYACGQGIFLEAALKSGIKIKGADLNRVGTHAENILQVDKPWGTLVCNDFKTVVMLDVIEHNEGIEQFLNDLKNFGVQNLIIKVPNAKGPSAKAALILKFIGKPGLWETLNLVGDYVPHYTFFSARGLERLLAKSGFNVVARMPLTEFGTELPERLRSHKSVLKFPLRIFGFFISAFSFLWCDNITVLAKVSAEKH